MKIIVYFANRKPEEETRKRQQSFYFSDPLTHLRGENVCPPVLTFRKQF